MSRSKHVSVRECHLASNDSVPAPSHRRARALPLSLEHRNSRQQNQTDDSNSSGTAQAVRSEHVTVQACHSPSRPVRECHLSSNDFVPAQSHRRARALPLSLEHRNSRQQNQTDDSNPSGTAQAVRSEHVTVQACHSPSRLVRECHLASNDFVPAPSHRRARALPLSLKHQNFASTKPN